jgi:hypothetical protein
MRAIGIRQDPIQVIFLLLQGRLPGTEREFLALETPLRRLEQILDDTREDMATQLQTAPTVIFLDSNDVGTSADQPVHPRAVGADPWANDDPSGAHRGTVANAPRTDRNVWERYSGRQANQTAGPQRYYVGGDDEEDAYTATDLSLDSRDFHTDAPPALIQSEKDQFNSAAYRLAKAQRRHHMQKPSRRTRRLIKHKGKGGG